LRILLAINNLGTGGAETFFCQQARALAEKGHKVFIWQVFYPIRNHQYQEVLNHKNISKFEFSNEDTEFLSRESRKIRRIWVERKLRRKINSLKIDLVNSHLFETDYFISTLVNLPHVISMHGSYEMYYHNRGVYVKDSYYGSSDFVELLSQIFKTSNYIITAAQKNEETILIHPKAPPHEMIYYGKNKINVLNKSTSIRNIGMISRGIESKGWNILIQSFKQLSQTNKDIRLTLGYTDSPYMDKLKKENEGVANINWIRDVTDLSCFFKDLDLFVFPTRYPAESLPNVIIEALAYHVPVISTDIGEIPNMLSSKDGYAGIVMSKNHNEREMIENLRFEIENLIHKPVNYIRIKYQCESAFYKFNLSQNIEKYLSVYNKVLSRND
jgi:glycosyltransferase involved in cell wall biosynthesis